MKKEQDVIRCRAYARAGLVGNPSDGYFGKTISFTFSNFFAEVVLYESPYIELLPSRRDRALYGSLDDLETTIRTCGYYGGIRLLQAALKKFYEYCQVHAIEFSDRNFSVRYFSNIPHRVGMAGSSAIITACFRALIKFYDVEIAAEQLANIVLSVESEELGIGAGLQDRVAQVYQGVTFMDFNEEQMRSQHYGRYERLDPSSLPNLYIAYKQELSEGSEVFHNNLRARFDDQEPTVVEAMKTWSNLAEEAKRALVEGRTNDVGPLLNQNFDLRRSLCRIHPENIEMVDVARSTGASAKFTGSGGAIVGTFEDDAMFCMLKERLAPLNVHLFKPQLI